MPSGPRPDPPTRCARVAFSGHYSDATWSNIMWLFLAGSGEIDHDTLVDLANQLGDAYGDNLMPWLTTTTELDTVQVTLYADGGPFDAIVSPARSGGVSTSKPTPASASVCLSWKIAAHYRGGHPRSYLCGIPGDELATARLVSSAYAAELQGGASDFHTAVEAITGLDGITQVEHGIVSFVNAGAWRTPPVFRRINDVEVDQRFDSQRRRLGPDLP